MFVRGSVAATQVISDKRYSGERRATEDTPRENSEAKLPPAGDSAAFDAAYYASRCKSEIWRLGAFAGNAEAPASEGEGDARIFEFFGRLGALLTAVRAGDIEGARAAADTLDMGALGDRPAGDEGAPTLAAELMRLLAADRSRETGAAASAASAYDTLSHFPSGDAAAP